MSQEPTSLLCTGLLRSQRVATWVCEGGGLRAEGRGGRRAAGTHLRGTPAAGGQLLRRAELGSQRELVWLLDEPAGGGGPQGRMEG